MRNRKLQRKKTGSGKISSLISYITTPSVYHSAMRYYLKPVGTTRPRNPLPARWWEEQKELLSATFFSYEPSIRKGDTLIYYAVGGEGYLCGAATVKSDPLQGFPKPHGWTEEGHKRFSWKVDVAVITKCLAAGGSPRYSQFRSQKVSNIGVWLTEKEGEMMVAAISRIEQK